MNFRTNPVPFSTNPNNTMLSSINSRSLLLSKADETSNSTTILDTLLRDKETELPDLFRSVNINKENLSLNRKVLKTLSRNDKSKAVDRGRNMTRNPTTKKILIDLRDEKRLSTSMRKNNSSMFSYSKLTSMNSFNSLNSSGMHDSKAQSSRIKVFSRIKPCSEQSFFGVKGCQITGTQISAEGSVFHFDGVFNGQTRQEAVFQEVGMQTIDDVMQGFNATIFVYGQTGSGKTYTMFGGVQQQRGLVPRAVEEVFKRMAGLGQGNRFSIKASMLEIYKQSLADLFAIESNPGDLKMRDSKQGLVIQNLSEIQITNQKTLLSLIDFGQQSRKVSSTRLNEHSSRSHTVIILNIQSTDQGKTRKGKLYLVDLAGSQKVSKSGAQGQTLEEAKKINLSLSCLGNVINALISRSKRQHIPYRDSKLTRVLQQSLAGNCITSIIVNMSEKVDCYDQSISTLKFAQRVSRIKKTVQAVSSLDNIKSVGKLHQIIHTLQKQLQTAKQQLNRYKHTDATTDNPTARQAIPSERANVQAKINGYNSKKTLKLKIRLDPVEFSVINMSSDDRMNSSLISPSLSSLSFNRSPVSSNISLNFSKDGILDSLSDPLDLRSNFSNRSYQNQ